MHSASHRIVVLYAPFRYTCVSIVLSVYMYICTYKALTVATQQFQIQTSTHVYDHYTVRYGLRFAHWCKVGCLLLNLLRSCWEFSLHNIFDLCCMQSICTARNHYMYGSHAVRAISGFCTMLKRFAMVHTCIHMPS